MASVDYKVNKIEKRLEKFDPESQKDKTPKNWIQKILKWW